MGVRERGRQGAARRSERPEAAAHKDDEDWQPYARANAHGPGDGGRARCTHAPTHVRTTYNPHTHHPLGHSHIPYTHTHTHTHTHTLAQTRGRKHAYLSTILQSFLQSIPRKWEMFGLMWTSFLSSSTVR